MITITCKQCFKQFEVYPYEVKSGRAKYCSKECKYKAFKVLFIGNKNGGHNWTGEERKIMSQRAKNNGYGKWMLGKKLPDSVKRKIGEALQGGNSGSFKRGFHYSVNTEFKRGLVPWNKGLGWKCSLTRLLRSSKKYKEWRDGVFKRDGYMCQFCGQVGGRLNADHIKPISLFKELIFELDNGRTLCGDCHKKTDTYARKICNYVCN